MQPYNYNMNQISRNMYSRNSFSRNQNFNQSDDRFFGGGFVAPLLLGGIAGYAIGNQQNMYPQGGFFYPQPFYPAYYNNNYYYSTYPYYY